MAEIVGRVASLWRYPVKSLSGEQVQSLDLDARGVTGDRVWSVRTPENKIGSGNTTRRFAAVPGLLLLRGRVTNDGVTVTLPTGSSTGSRVAAADHAISEFLGRPVSLARETDVDHFDDGPVSLIGAGSVAELAADVGAEVDPTRFRANILVAGLAPFAEDRSVGRAITVGDVELEVLLQSTRCVMIDMETADLPAQPRNLHTLGRLNDACLGVVARVVRPGRVQVGDEIALR